MEAHFLSGSYPAKFIEEFAAIGVIFSPVIGSVGAGAGGACRRIRVHPNAPQPSDTFCVFLALLFGLSDARSIRSRTKSDVCSD
jgi:hypothetical protein